MQTKSEAIILKVKPQSTGSALCVLFSKDYGKFAGMVKGTKSKAALLQVGNIVDVERFRRLETQLGSLSLSLVHSSAAQNFTDMRALQVLHYLAEVLNKGLKEEEKHASLYRVTREILLSLNQESLWDKLGFYELQLLADLGFGLSLSKESSVPCELGSDLTYVSPKSGRAVSEVVGEPYKAKLLPLPQLFGGKSEDFLDVFKLTGHFLEQALEGQNLQERDQLLQIGIKSEFRD